MRRRGEEGQGRERGVRKEREGAGMYRKSKPVFTQGLPLLFIIMKGSCHHHLFKGLDGAQALFLKF